MVKYRNECCDCASEGYPCLGESCPNRNVRVLVCDQCGSEVEDLYWLDGEQLCCDCVLENLEKVDEYEY